MTCKDCIHSGLCYKENDYENFPDRCGDFISNKVLQDIYQEGHYDGHLEGYTKAINEERPQGEEWIDNFIKNYNASKDFQITDIRDREKLLDDLIPKGEWIRTGSLGNGNAQYECSNCHYGDEQAESQEVPYCWHCGAKMRKGGADAE